LQEVSSLTSTLTRFNPLGEVTSLRQAMDRLFEDAFVGPTGWLTLASGQVWPQVDIYQTDDEVVVQAALPGIAPDAVEITLTGQMLTIRGEHKADESVKGDQYLYRELRYGTFHRQFQLPVRVDGDNANATFEHGLLTLRIPKAAEVRPRQITINAGGAGVQS
jgi:HSP20 family protein